jgi:hypothetical protein
VGLPESEKDRIAQIPIIRKVIDERRPSGGASERPKGRAAPPGIACGQARPAEPPKGGNLTFRVRAGDDRFAANIAIQAMVAATPKQAFR